MNAQEAKNPKAKAPMLQIEPTLDSGYTLLVLPAEITHAQATDCLRLLLTAAHAKKRDCSAVVVDTAPLVRFDSSALAVLVECRRTVLQADRRFTVRGMPARLAELARLYGVAELLPPDTSA